MINPNPRDVVLATLRRVREAGESHEMAARWIVEDLAAAGWLLIRQPEPAQPFIGKYWEPWEGVWNAE